MELTGEQIHTEVSKLASLSRGGDTNDLTWPTLQNHQITNTDEVTWDGDRVGGKSSTRLNEADSLANAVADTGWAGVVTCHDHLLLASVMMVMMTEWMEDAVSYAFDTAPKAVVMAFVVVVAHIVSGGSVGGMNFFFGNFDVLAGGLTTVLDFVSWVNATAIFALGDVDLRLVGLVSCGVAVDLDVNAALFCWAVVAGDIVSQPVEVKKEPRSKLPFASELYFGISVVTSIVAVPKVSHGFGE